MSPTQDGESVMAAQEEQRLLDRETGYKPPIPSHPAAATRLDEIRERHVAVDITEVPSDGRKCRWDDISWPCDASVLLAEVERLRGALEEIVQYEPDYSDVPPVSDHTDCAECAKWVGHPVQRGLCDRGYREIEARNRARDRAETGQQYDMRRIARSALGEPE